MGSHGRERHERLAAAAAPLNPTVNPWYRRVGGGDAEPAPGWYVMLPGLEHPVYLGAQAVDAEIRLLQLAGELRRVT